MGGAIAAVGSYLSTESSNMREINNEINLQKEEIDNITQQIISTSSLIQQLENITIALESNLALLNRTSENNTYILNSQNETIGTLKQEISDLFQQIALLAEQNNITLQTINQINGTVNTKYSQINVLQYQVNNMSNDILAINQKINYLQNQITSISNQVNQLSKQIAQLQQEIQQLLNGEDKDHSKD
ncbi:MAG: hypothetical protein QXE12_04135 [Conexivisphaerales archaeon]